MLIQKSEGQTRTEKLLADLCEKTFLKLWSYPNPYKDDGKELCDLLAVFENHVFIFFDRESLRFESSDKDTSLIWERWKKEVVEKQIQTAKGADKYLRQGRGIFLDPKKEGTFPIPLPKEGMVIHKIIVAHGAHEACKSFSEGNVYGSLAIIYGESSPFPFPFCVSLERKNPVHVLDSHNLEIILGEMDTFYDFSAYIQAKEEAIRKYDTLTYCGEEDLLAHYFLNFDGSNKKHFIGTSEENINMIMIGEGEWKDFIETAPYKRKKEEDKISYDVWDEIIQRTCQNALNGTLLGDGGVFARQSAIHEMAKEPRFMRRELSKAMVRAIQNFPEEIGSLARNLSFMPSFFREKGYVFLQLKVDNIKDYDGDYRPKRQAILEIACGAAKNKFPHLTQIIGIAIDAPKFSKRNSEDFILMNCDSWNDDQRDHYDKVNRDWGFFQTGATIKKTVHEFPQETPSQKKKIGRNEPCPCRSGKKFKKCHGYHT